MGRRLLLLACGMLLCPARPLRAQDDGPGTRELVVQHMKLVRSRRASFEEKLPAMEALLELGVEGPKALSEELARDLSALRKARLRDQTALLHGFERAAGRLGAARVTRQSQAEIDRLRAVVLEGPVTKPAIQAEKDPAVARLQELLVVRVGQVWDADEELFEDFGQVLDSLDLESALHAVWRDARRALEAHPDGARHLRRARAVPDPAGDDQALLQRLEQDARLALAMGEADRALMRSNGVDLAGIDPQEADGIARLNDLRVLLGLNALRVDLGLCDACRGHSRDMLEQGFFSHDSPVAGKETPWKRAALAGTSAGAENIAAGAELGADAIRMWWTSPGHHRNMLGGHRRVGLGRHERHWTQLFGG